MPHAQEYMAVFEPLVVEECCAQMLRGVEEGEVVLPHPGVPAKYEQARLRQHATFVCMHEAIHHRDSGVVR